MAMLIGILLVAAVAAAISAPLLRGNETGVQPEAPRGDDTLEREKAVALLAIREAEFDHATGKLSVSDYAVLRSQYEERALTAMKRIDARTPESVSDGGPGAASPYPPSRSGAGQQDDTLRSAGAAGALAGFCHTCGRAFETTDNFCAGCGTARIGSAASQAS